MPVDHPNTNRLERQSLVPKWLQTPTTTPPHKLNGSLQERQIIIYWPQLNTMWSVTTSRHNNNINNNNKINNNNNNININVPIKFLLTTKRTATKTITTTITILTTATTTTKQPQKIWVLVVISLVKFLKWISAISNIPSHQKIVCHTAKCQYLWLLFNFLFLFEQVSIQELHKHLHKPCFFTY